MTKSLLLKGMALALALLAAGAGGQEPLSGGDEAKLQDELRDVVRSLRETRTAYYGRQRARSEAIEAARAPLKRLETELSDLRDREREADRDLAEVRAELDKLKEKEASDAQRSAIASELEKLVTEAKDFVVRGIPYRVEDRTLRLGSSGGESLSGQFDRYWSFLQEELRIARSGEAFSAEVPLDAARTKPARLIRVGHLVLGYVSEDGQDAGLWNGSRWAPPAGPEDEKAIREAVEILDRRRAPELLSLPVLRRVGP